MKKTITLFLIGFFFIACTSASNTTSTAVKSEPVASTKLDRTSQAGIKGEWEITSVTYPGSNYFKVNSFQIADSQCMVGSKWNFISNNNKGSMSLTQSECIAFSSPIVWSINKEGIFVLKIIEAGVKSKKVTEGYLLKVANQTESSFQLIDLIDVAGQKKEITYQFEKIATSKN